jgi:tetratricopeptide (TPR) repeat protein
LTITSGDILSQQDRDGTWHTVKILEVDEFPDGTSTAHCLSYESSEAKPTMASVLKLGIRIWHAPILASSFASSWERIGNGAVANEELAGFVEYLKLTDFPRYLSVTGQDAGELVRKANEHYRLAITLGEQGKRNEAIAEYTVAVELFPLFYEAIDNRAFTYMELGKYQDALRDFELSLQVNPEGVTAFFSKGECLMKLGKLAEAGVMFDQGVTRFPEQRDLFSKFLKQVREMQRKG